MRRELLEAEKGFFFFLWQIILLQIMNWTGHYKKDK